MTKKVLVLFALASVAAFGFHSKYLPNYEIDTECSKLLHKRAFDICYNCKWKTPKLVIYKVDGALIDSKNLPREGIRFRPDYQLPSRCRSYPRDYSGTGYDRGHLAPNAVFDYSRIIQKETFLMSNIAPQKPKLNRKLWAKIERFVRFMARRNGFVKAITGVCGSKGTIKNHVNIPAYWYKIIFLPDGRTISFLAPNTNENMDKARAKQFLVPIEKIEKICNFTITPK